MDFKFYDIPTQSIGSDYESPSVSALHAQKDGTLLCGLMFSKPSLFRIHLDEKQNPREFENLAKEAGFDDDVFGVMHGLRPSVSGDTVFSVIHEGMLPGFLRGIMGGKLKNQKGPELLSFLKKQEGGMGAYLRHSVVQIADGKIFTRRFKDPGILWDLDHIGVNVYGMGSRSIFREPYLNTEKREVMRKDLGFNQRIARDVDGTFWLADENNRLMRMSLSDIKPKRTPLKLPDESGIFLSAMSHVDGWMYLVCENSKTLMRVRMNPISHEEESQKVIKLEGRISGLCTVEDPRVNKAYITLDTPAGVEVYSLDLIRPEDPEIMPPVPALKKLGLCSEIKSVNSLTATFPPIVSEESTEEPLEAWKKYPMPVLWAGEGYLGWGVNSTKSTRLLKISGI